MSAPLSLAAGNVQEFAPALMPAAAGAAGFDLTGMWVDLDTWTDSTTRAVRDTCSDAGVGVLDVEVLWINPGNNDHLLRTIDIGNELGARFALAVSSDPDATGTCRAFEALCRRAETGTLTVVLEFLPITCVRSLADALSIVRAVDHPRGGILVDTLHLARTGGTPADLAALDPDLFPYVQIADAPAIAPGTDHDALLSEAIDGRLLPGDGELPISAVLDALAPDAPVSPEIRSRALRERYPDITERAKAIAAASRRLLNSR